MLIGLWICKAVGGKSRNFIEKLELFKGGDSEFSGIYSHKNSIPVSSTLGEHGDKSKKFKLSL